MSKFILIITMFFLIISAVHSQNFWTISNPEAEQIIEGNYDPADYMPEVIINHPDSIIQGIISGISTDSLQAYLEKIETYYNRNTGSDTISDTRGIGAVRRWIHGKFNEYREASNNRLVTSYLDFEVAVCGQFNHRNVFVVLPGMDTTNKEILLVEGHYDTRCEGVCDTACYSPGMDDNGSGTVLVMELARVMSRFAFDHTIVFTTVTGEDQGLYGGRAWARYLKYYEIPFMACFNNDVVGGIACGASSSPPSCPYINHIDSTNVRIFSYSMSNDSSRSSKHKQLARYIKLQQEEHINPLIPVPMNINIIINEDRVGRSGDHIPFREKGFAAIRFCSQNEHGDGSGTPPDRQHTTTDVLGLDLTVPPDGTIDTFFVDMNYLKRNCISNGVNLGLLAISPPQPDPEFIPLDNGIKIVLHDEDSIFQHYRVGVRTQGSGSLYWDTVLTFQNTSELVIEGLIHDKEYYFSIANVENSVESLFSYEYDITIVSTGRSQLEKSGLKSIQNYPNPAGEFTFIKINASDFAGKRNGKIVIKDLSGREIITRKILIGPGVNIEKIDGIHHLNGFYTYSLFIDKQHVVTNKMIIIN